ncbi:MAG TPA: NAD(P)/FAD-dependent oxidoreductase [Thermoanaerobaculia bacterium]|nr:NAD(P)/FAD-dependent oxidoreductase [Thermoanaerobaculia bacterium]
MKTAVIIGAGPAGLTAAYELLEHGVARPLVLEQSSLMGGIARTVEHHGNRIDIGGHRFFSKSDRVMSWWLDKMPLQRGASGKMDLSYQRRSTTLHTDGDGPDPDQVDEVMLVRERRSRIYYRRRFYDYPISLSPGTLYNLGAWRSLRIGLSYLKSAAFPEREEKNLEQFLRNRFGGELYRTFFKDYTEKVWGVQCTDISAEWGAQRIKGLSVWKAVTHFVGKLLQRGDRGLAQKGSETSLIERFLYPKLGPGQMWDVVRRLVEERGGEVLTERKVVAVHADEGRIVAVTAEDRRTGEQTRIEGDAFFSTMPVRSLVRALDCPVPAAVREVSEGLLYRDFITVGLLVPRLRIEDEPGSGRVADNWIYIQEPEVKVGRLQIFNNWSPYMVADPNTVWLGLEYFCYDTDDLWRMSDADLLRLGEDEMARIGVIERGTVLDGVVLRMPKTYPAYFGTYDRFDEVRDFLDGFENLFPVGRNGMHKYNNQDHSMLTAMLAVENLRDGRTDKSNLWDVNTEGEYHEERK